MKIFLTLLSFCTYPVVLPHIPIEQRAVFHGDYATDIFMYLRAGLICISALLMAPFIKRPNFLILSYLFLLTLSVTLNPFRTTTIFGTPNYYEGFLVIVSYLIFAMKQEFPEKAVKISVYIIGALAILQVIYGTYFNCPLLYWIIPKNIKLEEGYHTLYSTFGNPNHLGLFCALLFCL